MAKKILKREVDALAGKYGDALVRWGENNQSTISAHIRYWDARAQYATDHGKEYAS